MARPSLPARAQRVSRAAAAALTAASLAAVLAACGSEEVGGASNEVDVSHVHGLATDPDDADRLYVATHHGLAAYSDDEGLRPVGSSRNDVMGFSVGPGGTLYASGHPGEGEDAPFALGLIRSDDAGTTWEPVSLSGEADFHALAADEDGVYGFDSANGLLRTSADGVKWTDIATDAGFIDLTADPVSSRVVGTTTERAVVASTDDGRSFQPVEEAPPLVLVEYSPEGDLLGIDSRGRVRSASPDGQWEIRGGQADSGLQAFTAGPGGRVWILDGAGLRRSTDDGASFEPAPAW